MKPLVVKPENSKADCLEEKLATVYRIYSYCRNFIFMSAVLQRLTCYEDLPEDLEVKAVQTQILWLRLIK